MVTMTHQTLSLEKYWKLLPATLKKTISVAALVNLESTTTKVSLSDTKSDQYLIFSNY